MKKRIIKKYHVKDNVKDWICLVTAGLVMVIAVCFYTYRIDTINNNPDGYTEAGRSHAVNVQILR